MQRYPRDLHGYGATPPAASWPKAARIAVQVVVNFEEGGENNTLHGDRASEAFLSEMSGASPWPGQRHWNMESIYEYGARAGFWRLHRVLTERAIPTTVFGVAEALARAPAQVAAMKDAGWEIASHGLKWIDYRDFDRDSERRHLEAAVALHTQVVGAPPVGWYTGRCTMHTVALVAEHGGFVYSADSYADDLPYWHTSDHQPLLMVPYTLDANDMRFAVAAGFNSGDQFFTYLKDTFDALLAEGAAGAPKMMSIGLHCRLVGRPGRAQALARFLDYALAHDGVWFATREEIAMHWHTHFPYRPAALRPSSLTSDEFVECFGGVFDHSPWIAERAWQLELGPAHDTAVGIHSALVRIFRSAPEDERFGVLKAYPDLAGRLAAAHRVTPESAADQLAAGRDALTDDARAELENLNAEYVERYGFPFIIAERGLSADEIRTTFRARILNGRDAEFAEACRQVERIALLRLQEMLGS
ncbi:MAG: allantoinase PuuE [Pseudomonadota bacterium]